MGLGKNDKLKGEISSDGDDFAATHEATEVS